VLINEVIDEGIVIEVSLEQCSFLWREFKKEAFLGSLLTTYQESG
jgi:hypothetical protein